MKDSKQDPALQDLSDEALVALAKGGHDDAMALLIARMAPMARARAATYPNALLDFEDLAQEGMLGLLSAVYNYDPANGASFRTFANVCIINRIQSGLRAVTRKKDLPLHSYVPLDEQELPLGKHPASTGNPEELLIAKEGAEEINVFIRNNLSEFEQNVFELFVSGHSYEEIAQSLRVAAKSVDNALQRIRRKLRTMT